MGRPSRLTRYFVEEVDQPGRYSDGRGGNGLSLRVRLSRDGKTINKTWEQRITVPGEDRVRTLGMGPYSNLKLTAAREIAAENVRLIKAAHPRRMLIDRLLDDAPEASGLGPVDLNTPQLSMNAPPPAVPTFSEVAETYIKAQAGRWKPESRTEKLNRALLANFAVLVIGNLPVNQVDSSHITDVLAPIWHTKAPSAKKLAGIIRSVMRFAVGKRYIADDPTDRALLGLGQQNHKTKHSGSIPYAEVSEALDYVRESKSYEDKKLALELLVLTATRTTEVRGMRRGEVDFNTFTWTIPADRMKGGLEHRVPLSRATTDLLVKVWKDGSADDLVFTAKDGAMLPLDGFRQLFQRRYPEATPHGFRTSFRGWAAERTEYPREITAHAIAHVEGSESERAYVRTDFFEKRRALMADWAAFLTGEGGQHLHPAP